MGVFGDDEEDDSSSSDSEMVPPGESLPGGGGSLDGRRQPGRLRPEGRHSRRAPVTSALTACKVGSGGAPVAASIPAWQAGGSEVGDAFEADGVVFSTSSLA